MIEIRGWDKSPSLSIILGLFNKTQWLSGLYYADFISFYSPTQLCGGGTTKSNSNELPISVPLSLVHRSILLPSFYGILVLCKFRKTYESRAVFTSEWKSPSSFVEEIVKRSLAGLLLGTAFVVFNQNNFIRNLKLLLRFEEGKMSVVCRDDDNPDVYLKVRMGADQEPVITQLEKNDNQVLK